MMKLLIRIYFVALLLCSQSLWALQKVDFDYANLLSNDSLLTISSKCIESGVSPDSTLVYLYIITNRYDSGMSLMEKRQVVNAYLTQWNIFSLYLNNQSKAYESLNRAQSICEKNGFSLGRVNLNYGCMYLTAANYCDDKSLYKMSIDYFKKAITTAIEEHDRDLEATAFSNLVGAAGVIDSVAFLEKYYCRLKADSSQTDYLMTRYACLLYEGLVQMSRKEYKRALATFEKQRSLLDGMEWGSRLSIASLHSTAEVLIDMGDYDKALNTLNQTEYLSKLEGLDDARLLCYHIKADIFEKMNRRNDSNRELMRYYALKDSMINSQMFSFVMANDFMRKLDNLELSMEEVQRQKQARGQMLIIAIIVLVIVGIFSFLLFRRNRVLRQLNEALYTRAAEAAKRASDERETRLLAEAKAREAAENTFTPKYQGTNLNDDDKNDVMSRILSLIDSTDCYLQPDFSLSRLSQMSGISSKNISQVINEKTGDNFNAFINRFRVNEACRRIDLPSDDYSNFTLEAIGTSVGFGSRQSFVTAFKKVTGLTPSAYQNVSKTRRNV
ncbi:MAG: helix-turn-helix domain-containing protein [Muribaculaceae bacterium]